MHQFDIASSILATCLRTGVGISMRPGTQQPSRLLELYDFEGCPHCRLVREVLTELDLDAMLYPCPKGGQRFRPTVVEKGGKAQFPFLNDPNSGVEMFEAADIIVYLYDTYRHSPPPLRWRLVELQRLGSTLATIPRMGSGVRVRASRFPEQPLELYSFESSPFARPVRDLLCVLEIPYILRSMGRSTGADWIPPRLRDALSIDTPPQTRNRQALQERAGRVTVPYLVDANSGVELAESAQIVKYLRTTYAL